MSYGLIFGALFALFVFLGLIGGLVWWVRRPISARRKSHGALPLFGHDRAVVYSRAKDDDQDKNTGLSLPKTKIVTPDTGRAASRAI